MSGRRRGILALALIVAVAAVALFAPTVTPFGPRASGPAPSVASGAWFCPHGGGADWRTVLTIANPGSAPVDIRITTYAEEGRPRRGELEVAAGDTRRVEVEALARESGSMVEFFGGWVAVGWTSRAGGDERGVAAEPCLADTSDTWYLPDASTVEDEEDSVVLLNPFSVDAIVSFTLLTPGRDPTRTEALTNVIVPARTARTMRLGRTLLGEAAVSTIVEVSVGRIAAALLAVTGATGIRASVGYAGLPPAGVVLVGGDDSGRSDLVIMAPPGSSPPLDATLLGSGPEQPVAGLPEAELPPGSSRAFPVATGPGSAIAIGTPGVPTARRHVGRSGDDGSSIGLLPAASWVVLPTLTAGPFHSDIVLANPGTTPVRVELRPLGGGGLAITLTVPARGTIAAPASFAASVAEYGVLVVAQDGAIVAASASSSLGKDGRAAYAVANGVPIPVGSISG